MDIKYNAFLECFTVNEKDNYNNAFQAKFYKKDGFNTKEDVENYLKKYCKKP